MLKVKSLSLPLQRRIGPHLGEISRWEIQDCKQLSYRRTMMLYPNARPRPKLFKTSFKNSRKVHLKYRFFFYFSLSFCHDSFFEVTPMLFHHCGIYCTKCQFFLSRNEMQIAWFWTSDTSCCSGNETGCPTESASITSSIESDNKKLEYLICPLSRFN